MIQDSIDLVQKYFDDRCKEIESLAKRGDVWVFLCDLVMIDYLTNMSNGIRSQSMLRSYPKFIRDYFDDKYTNFEFPNKEKDLPEQIFFLRCEIVHQFSLKPGNQEIHNGARSRSILLGHETLQEHETNVLKHLSLYTDKHCNSVVFTAEQFTKDVRSAITKLFTKAKNDNNISDKIIKYITEHPPISAQWE